VNELTPKTARESYVEMRQLVMPNDTNPQNTIFGGTIMSWIDMAAAMVAQRHTRRTCVTVHIDDISFLAPIRVGEHAVIKASVNYTGKTSVMIGTKVMAENPMTGELRHTTTAYLTFVALDNIGRPTSVPPLLLETPEDHRRFQEAKKRFEENKQKSSKA
jgi:acyl-CoA hydrolase